MSNSLVKVPFRGSEIECAKDGAGKVWVSIRKPCEILGIDHEAQRKRLVRSEWATTSIMEAVAADGKTRPMLFVELDTFPMWLATIDSSRVRAESREMLLAYQREARNVLADHFLGRKQDASLAAIELALSKIADAIQSLASSHQALVTRVERLEEIASGSPGCIGTGAAAMIKARLLRCARAQDSDKWRSVRARLDADLRDAVNWHGLSRHMRTWEWLPKSRLPEVEHWLAQCERESDRVGKALAAERQQKLFS